MMRYSKRQFDRAQMWRTMRLRLRLSAYRVMGLRREGS
jgi:hypothetical protein